MCSRSGDVELERATGLKVKIQDARGESGFLTLYYRELEQLDGVVKIAGKHKRIREAHFAQH